MKNIHKLIVISCFAFILNSNAQNTTANDSIPPLPYNFNANQNGGLFLNGTTTEVIYDQATGKYIFVDKIGDYYVKRPIYMTADEYKQYRLKRDMLDYYKSKVSAIDGKKKGSDDAKKDLLPKYYVNSKFFESIFGSNEIEINVQGNVMVSMGILYQKVDNPQISQRNRQSTTFDFDQQISASINAKIGTRVNVNINYDTQSTFDFQNLIKLEYEPTEDDIIQKIEVGNVSMPLQSSLIAGAQNLFGFKTKLQFGATEVTAVFARQQSQTRSVSAEGGSTVHEFEIKASQYDKDRHFFLAQKFRNNYNNALSNFPLINSSVNITRVELWITNRNNQTEDVRNIVALADLGEANATDGTESNFVNFTEVSQIGANPHHPSNDANNLIDKLNATVGSPDYIRTIGSVTTGMVGFTQGADYSVLENAKKLTLGQDFSIHPTLGYISLNRLLTESEVLAVAYEYTEADQFSGEINTYQVGELTGNGIDAPNNLIVKLLRPEIISTELDAITGGGMRDNPLWNLMMKNVYDLRSYQMNPDGFRLEVMYQDPTTGVPLNILQTASTTNIITEPSAQPRDAQQIPLLNMMRIDRLDQSNNSEYTGDGFFDYVEGLTVNSQQGLLYFPVVEPFGDHLDGIQESGLLTDPADDIFIFRELYNRTQPDAQNNFQSKDRYLLKGYYKSEGRNGIALGAFNVPRGSVNVTTGGRVLVEGVDYVVDYTIGSVQIINPSLLASNAPIQVSVESNNSFSTQNRRFFGLDVQHKFSEKFALGGTFLNLRERPFTQKAQFGNEPVNNSIVGFNLTYNTEVPKLTKWVNYLPNIDTDVPSNLSIRAEAAYLIPNSPKGIELNGEAASYLDDFEGTQIPLNIDTAQQWKLASTPQGQSAASGLDFTGLTTGDTSPLAFSKKRSRLAWYSIDRLFYGSSLRPGNIDDDELSRAEVRSVSFEELFPNLDLDVTQTNIIRTFDLAYYPEERGTYNYDTDNIDSNTGKFIDPENRWGGIMRSLTTTDFQQANVEYIQFWMMDPYENYSINQEEGNSNTTVNPADLEGELYFNLGNISEDILNDGRKMFENGLPEDGIQDATVGPTQNVESTVYSSIPTIQSLLNAFSEDDNDRPNQDIGLDGLKDEDERIKYDAYLQALSGNAFTEANSDPSTDNYKHFRAGGDGSILSRYKNFNKTQGNSETINNSSESFPTSATAFPDIEDLNRDQTMSTAEGYYQYKIPISQANLVVGENNIVDAKTTTVTLPNGTQQNVTWYQYRIPVQSGGEAINISSFNSIRFMRMFVTKFKKPIVLRFGKLELVRGNWRRYTKTLTEPTPVPLVELSAQQNGNFEVGVVNIQENERRIPIPYVLPPGVRRERLQGSTSIQRQNEQSLSVKVADLEVDETRLVYKNTTFDIRMFKKYKMFIHAESTKSDDLVLDGEIAAIIRLGSDLVDNYYEIEMPLNITALTGEISAEDVWKNNLDAALEKFGEARLKRFETNLPVNEVYTFPEDLGNYTLRVKGNPTLSKIKSMMLGVRNISLKEQSAEVWFNEMRVADFDNEGGWAAVANINANIADFADVAVSGAMSTQGFGSLDQKVNERSQSDKKQYDIVTNINLGQLLPKNYGIKLPLNVSVAEEFKDPKYDPQYQDVLFEDTNSTNSPNRDNATDYTKRRSLSLINVRKERTNQKKKQRFYDVENLSASFAYNDIFHKDYNVERFLDQNVRAGATYNYSFEPKTIEPFKNSKFLGKKKYLKIIKDFNINYLPSAFSVNSNIIRSYNEQLSRPLIDDPSFPELPSLERRRFAFDWDYSIAYDLTKSLQFNFRAANSYIHDDFEKDANDEVINGQLFDKFFTTGRPQHYTQKLEATYKLPLNKIPVFDFITATYNYTADFDWQATISPTHPDFELLGNTIQNANTHNLNADLNMNKLYKRIGVNKLFRNNSRAKFLKKKAKEKKKKAKALEKEQKKNKDKEPKDGKLITKGKDKLKTNKDKNVSLNNKSKSGEKLSKSKRKKLSFGKKLIVGAVDVLTSVKKIRISYTENNGTFLPGYLPEVGFLGRDNVSGGLAPTLGFVFGSQSSILNTALANNWLATREVSGLIPEPFYNKTYSNTHFEDLKLNFNVKPAKNFKIDVSANKTLTKNISQQLDIITDSTDPNYNPFNSPIYEVGNFAISTMMINTSFKNTDDLFQDFLSNRSIIAERLANSTGRNISGFSNGEITPNATTNYSNQSVLLPAFFAAYAGRDVNKVKTSAFKNIPLPNWRVSYKGLSKIKAFKKIFRTITIEHNYQSAYSILGFNSNLQFDNNNLTQLDAADNYINKLQFQGVNLVEQFSPLIKIDVKMKNSFSFRGEIKKDRSINLNFANSSITEIDGKEYVVGLGYKLKDVKWKIKTGATKTTFKGDVNLRADVGLRDNITIIRSITNQTDQITGGQRIFTLKFTADYNLNKNLRASFFYDQNSSRFKISTTYPRNSISAGLSIRYNIGN